MPTNIPARDPAVAETDAAAVAPARARLRPYVTKSLSLARPRPPGHGRGWRRRRALASRRPCLAPHPYNYRVPLRVQQEDRVYVRPKQITPASRLGGA